MPMIGTEFYDRLITAIDDNLAAHDYDAALFPLLNDRRIERSANQCPASGNRLCSLRSDGDLSE
jgi:hypothetical protein